MCKPDGDSEAAVKLHSRWRQPYRELKLRAWSMAMAINGDLLGENRRARPGASRLARRYTWAAALGTV